MKKRNNIFANIIKENYAFLLLLVFLTIVISIQGCQPSSPTLSIGNCCKIKDPTNLETKDCIPASLSNAECAAIALLSGSSYELAPASSCLNFERNPDCGTTIRATIISLKLDNIPITDYTNHISGINIIGSRPPRIEPGIIGNSLNFYGIPGNYVTVSNSSILYPQYISFTAWINAKRTNVLVGPHEYNTILSKYGSLSGLERAYNFYLVNGTLRLSLYSSSGTDVDVYNLDGPNLWDDKWHFVAATYDSSIAKTYIDGVLIASKAGSWSHTNSNAMVTLGARKTNTGTYDLYFNGSMDEVNIYSMALTDEEIYAIYQGYQGIDTFNSENTICPYHGAGYSDKFSNLDLTKWSVVGDYISLDNGRIKYNLPSSSSQVYNAIHSKDKFTFDGDFDMMISYDVSNSSSGYSSEVRGWSVGLQVLTNLARTGLDKRASIQRIFNGSDGHKYEAGYTLDNVWTGDTATNDKIPDIMGRLRLRREGGNIYAYYWGWENSRWEYAGDTNGYLIISGFTEPVYVRIDSDNRGGFPHIISYIDNFMVGCLPGTAKLLDPVNIGDTSIHVEGGEIYKWAVGDTIYLGSSNEGYVITIIEYTNSADVGLDRPAEEEQDADNTVTEDESAYCSGGGKDYCADGDWNLISGDFANGQCFPITPNIVRCTEEDGKYTVTYDECGSGKSCMPDWGCVSISDQCSDAEGGTYEVDSGGYNTLCITDGEKGGHGYGGFFKDKGEHCVSYRCYPICGVGGSTAYWYKSGDITRTPPYTSVGCAEGITGYCQSRG